MARSARSAGAGGAQRESNVAHIRDQPRSVEPVAAEIEVAVITMIDAAVDYPTLSECCERKLEQLSNMRDVRLCPLCGQVSGFAHPGAQRWRQRARAEAKLLPAAMQQRHRLRTDLHP